MPQIFLAGVGGPSDPTIARGNITSLLKHLELAEKKHDVTCRRDAPTFRHIFGTFILRSFSFACLFHYSVFLLIVALSSFLLRLHFRVTVPAITGRLEQHALAPKYRAEVASRL
jgi:hypothetical protein